MGIRNSLRGFEISVWTNSLRSLLAPSSGGRSLHISSPQTRFLNSLTFPSKFSSSSLKNLSRYSPFQALPKWGVAPIKTNPFGGFSREANTERVAPKDQPTKRVFPSILSTTFWTSSPKDLYSKLWCSTSPRPSRGLKTSGQKAHPWTVRIFKPIWGLFFQPLPLFGYEFPYYLQRLGV